MPIVKNKKSARRKSALILLILILLFPKPVRSQEEYDYNIDGYSLYFDILDETRVKGILRGQLENTNKLLF